MKIISLALVLCTTLVTSGAAQASLIDRGRGLIYDTDLNVTWMADANLAQTLGYTVDGKMTYSQALYGIGLLNVANHWGYHDWRLPFTPQQDATCSDQTLDFLGTNYSSGTNCTGSEMGHLFYNELGGVTGQSITTTHNVNYDWFHNFQSGYYWSRESLSTVGVIFDLGVIFDFGSGHQGSDFQTNSWYALVVRSGDVATVPVPAAVWLLGSGLLGLAGVARRKAA